MWGGNHHHKRLSWVKWDVVCLPKSEGGLGIKDLSKFNAALRGRWIWDLASNHNQLWGRVLISKYGGWSDLQWGRDKGWHSQWWKDLRKLYEVCFRDLGLKEKRSVILRVENRVRKIWREIGFHLSEFGGNSFQFSLMIDVSNWPTVMLL